MIDRVPKFLVYLTQKIWLLKPLYLLFFIAWMATALNFTLAQTLDVEVEVDVEEQLVYADSLKDSNPSVLSKILQNLSVELLSQQELENYQYLLAYSQFQNNNIDEALTALKQLSVQANTKIKYRALITLVDLNTLAENWADGINAARILSEAIEKTNDNAISTLAYASLSILFNTVGDFDAAISNANKLLNKTKRPEYICLGNANKLVAQIKKQYQSVSKTLIISGIKSCQGAENLDWKNMIILHYSKMLLESSDVKEAITQLSESLHELENSGDTFLIAQYYAHLGKAYFDLGDYENANLFASKSVSTYGFRNDQESALVAFKTLYQVAQHNSNLRQALIFHKSYFAAFNAYFQSIRSRQLAIQKYELDNLEKQTQLVLLDRENDLLKTQIELDQKRQENNQLAIALAASLIILLIFWSYRSRRSQKKLRLLVNTDELTGIVNRSYFQQLANIALQQSKAVKNNACFILFDLDNFKRINDKLGHLAGDLALKSAVKGVQRICRADDLIARMGGKEFAILVPNCSLEQATNFAEECRKSLQKLTFDIEYPRLKITASFGVADTDQCGYHYDKIFGGADTALYTAKALGRNKVYVFNSSL